jgi:hypothetical protein
MTDLFSKFDALIEQRRTLLDTGVTDPFNLVMEKVLSPTVAICNGRETILLGTYNYMGMTFDDDVIAAGKQAFDDFGAGTTGSRVLNGTFFHHRDVEAALREFYAFRPDIRPIWVSFRRLPARATISSLISTAMRQSMTAAPWAMPKSCLSATMISRRWKSG